MKFLRSLFNHGAIIENSKICVGVCSPDRDSEGESPLIPSSYRDENNTENS